ncbi:hypothetical protein H2202_002369 [Exophiala xenobiotica]|nr:hypothetical protein H2202_002369 [Exophiala xenobiotica]KAK5208635.1 hypothetical protein LTR41_005862 [Exophiala xenobiotica]KAK5318953.1 hypothetical protein LTR93_007647 [Exophiala xenobiotica]KAK5372401.1 hypothetical protein LTS13_006141 [Exophiala xenobiotica]KAK5393918.1 hypothetical protein LTR79_008862 [Exophiala xenobiotica]
MASVTSSQIISPDNIAAGYSKTSRRQYQSCDQCRKSRRACDASALRVVNFPLGEDEGANPSLPTCEACSNCARTSKKCTFDWLRLRPLQNLPKGVKRKLESTGFPEAVIALTHATSEEPSQPSREYGASLVTDESFQFGCLPSLNGHASSDGGHTTAASSAQSNGSLRLKPSSEDRNSLEFQSPSVPHTISNYNLHPPQFRSPVVVPLSRPRAARPEKPTTDWNPPSLDRFDTCTSATSYDSTDSRTISAASQISYSATSASSDSGGENDHAKKSRLHQVAMGTTTSAPKPPERFSFDEFARRGSTGSSAVSSGRRQSSSPLSSRQVRFADGAMKTMIATGLLRIYHDSFENSLSCWVTEQNCPYETELNDLLAQVTPGSGTAEEAAFRLVDNRIFSRVSRLDSAFSQLRGRELSPFENRASNNALNAAIMAFASQWSHSSHNAFWRSKEGRSKMQAWQNNGRTLFPPTSRPNDPILSTDCERMIQKTLWHEARKAIQATTEVDSFKVILAYMLFALTQRPVDENPKSARDSSKDATTSFEQQNNLRETSEETGSAAAAPATPTHEEWDPFQTSELEGLASPPVYLETAVRNLFSWRQKVERSRRMRSKSKNKADNALAALALKDQQTFNILFWLGVMCDTTSSAITRRPLVIADEDCGMIREKLASISLNNDNVGSHWPEGAPLNTTDHQQDDDDDCEALWGKYLLGFKPTGPRNLVPRWPCSFDEAALVLQEAIPVKVLMFRKVGQLQTLAYRRSAPSKLEKCIEEALEVYQHWNTTYGQFMLDCVAQHNQLPPHVQSWYVILDGHWHYGCLLLADKISQTDREDRTMKVQRQLRTHCSLIAGLRKDNAHAIARIAEASLSEHGPSFRNNSEFHFACNGSAILTEPWTDILVRAMGSACKIFINWLAAWDTPTDSMHEWVVKNTVYDDLYLQAEICIQGMTLLGRKSDAANYTAEVFWKKLSKVCEGRRAPPTDSVEAEKASPKALGSRGAYKHSAVAPVSVHPTPPALDQQREQCFEGRAVW